MKINKEIKRKILMDRLLIGLARVVFAIVVLGIVALVLSSCSSEQAVTKEPCNYDCGKLISKYHYREAKLVSYTYVNKCNDTIVDIIELDEEQLAQDNGISYFINTYQLKDYYCDEKI